MRSQQLLKADMTAVAGARLAKTGPRMDFPLRKYVPYIGCEQEAKSWQRKSE